MKRLNLTILTVLILTISLSISSIDCSASEPYFTDLVEAELCNQEKIDAYNYIVNSDVFKAYSNEINGFKHVISNISHSASETTILIRCFNDDIAVYKYFAEGNVLGIVSKTDETKISYKMYQFRTVASILNPDGSLKVEFSSKGDYMYSDKYTHNDFNYIKSPHYYGIGSDTNLVSCDVPVYSTMEDACLALEGNDIKPLYGNMISYSQADADKLYFKSFNVIPHVGTDLSASFFTFNYELSDYAKQHKDDLSIYISSQYSFGIVGNPIAEQYLRSNTWGNIIDLSNNKGYFTLCCSDIKSLVDFKNKWQFTDDNIVGRMKTFDIANTFAHTLCPDLDIVEITTSFLSFTVQLRTYDSNDNYISGQWKSFTYDFLTHESNTAGVVPDKDNWLSNENPTYTVDADGTQTHNSYFYEDTVTNTDNSTTTKYYYTDGDKTTEITYNQYTNNEVPKGMSNPWIVNAEGGNSSATGGNSSIGDINININNNMGHGDYVDISPADYKLFIDALQSLFAEVDTNGGLFLLLKDIYSMYPPEIWLVVGGGLSAVVIVSIVKIARG